MISIFLADDHPIVRQGLRMLLDAEPGFNVIGESGDGLEAAEIVERLKPDVLIVDVMLPGLSGLDVTRHVRKRAPATRVIVLSMYDNEAYVIQALKNGAMGYVLKDALSDQILEAIREAVEGRRYLSPPLSDRVIEANVSRAEISAEDSYEALTHREREVLHLAAEGRTSSEIADRLGISPRTAEAHRGNLMHKLGLRNQTDLVRYAVRRGILTAD